MAAEAAAGLLAACLPVALAARGEGGGRRRGGGIPG